METALTNTYTPPVDKLLTYGETQRLSPDEWPNYVEELGLVPEHVPDLIRMASDAQLNDAEPEDVRGWAPMHAYRAICQMHVETEIDALLSLIEIFLDSNDFALEEMRYVFSVIGPSTLPKIAEYMANSSHDEWARVCASEAVEEIGLNWPESRSGCVRILMVQLESFEENGYHFNAFLIHALAKLQAVEAAPLIEQAFAANCVEEFVQGDWDDVQVDLGLKSEEELKAQRAREGEEWAREREIERYGAPLLPGYKRTSLSSEYERTSPLISHKSSHKSEGAAHKKAKNKMSKQSRKKNRKR